MRPLNRPSGDSWMSVFPMRKRASSAVSEGRYERESCRVAGFGIGGRNRRELYRWGKHPIPECVSIGYRQMMAGQARRYPMKPHTKFLLGSAIIAAIQLAQTGCVGGGGGYDGGVSYGGGPWIDNEVVVTGGGRGWFGGGDRSGGGGYVHPNAGGHAAAPRASESHAGGGESHPSGGGSHPSGGDDHHK